MNQKLPKIRVDFYISGDTFDVEIITKRIGVNSTNIKRKSECSVTSTALTYWRLSTEDSYCKAVS